MQNEKKVVELNIADVLPNRFQPRIKFDENSINELALSIRKYGVIQPIVVRKIGDKYEIIAGERRYKASVVAGKQTIPAIISEMTDKDSVEIALIENVQREDLTPIEKAISYKKILDMGYMSQEDLAQKVGKSQSSIANTLRLLNLSDDVQEALLENKISERHARSLLKLKDEKQQVEMLNRIINERLTVRKTDEEIDKMLNENINSNVQPVENFTPEEVVQIPDIELSSIDTTKLPGFMDIEKIEQTAQNITPQEKPVANLNDLLKSNTPSPAPKTETNPVHEGKFFNYFEEPSVEKNNNQNDFKLENFFNSMDLDNSNNSNVDTNSNIEPTIPEVPTMPSVDESTSNIEPTVPEVPTMPSVDESTSSIEPTVPEIPTMPSVDESTSSIEPTVPEIPTMPSVDESTSSIEPTVPEVPTMPNISTNSIESSSNYTPLYEVPIADNTKEIPTIDTQPEQTFTVNNQTVENNISAQNNGTTITAAVPSMRLALNTIRECENTLEKYGFTIDVEEIDFEDSYQVIFKIEKK